MTTSTPRSSGASDAQTVVRSLLSFGQHLRDGNAAIFRGSGVTPQQYAVLKALHAAGDAGLPTLAIAARLLERAPGITRLVDRLEARGLVERTRGADRRQVLCRLSDHGRRLILELDGRFEGFCERALASLNHNEVNVLLHLIRRIGSGARIAV